MDGESMDVFTHRIYTSSPVTSLEHINLLEISLRMSASLSHGRHQ